MSRPTLCFDDGYEDTTPDLKDEVKELQTALNKQGFSLTADGLFGRGTENAVKKFQAAHGLTVDGVVGANTWRALLGGQSPSVRQPPSVQPSATVPQPSLVSAPAAAASVGVFPTTYSPNDPSLTQQLAAANKYRAFIESAAAQFGFQPCVIAGIGSRESGWGLALKPVGPTGTGDFARRRAKPPLRSGPLPPDGGGFGRGLMQIDFDAHEFAQTGNWRDPQANIRQGCQILAQIMTFLKKRTNLQGRELLRASLAAYNAGPGKVLKAIQANQDVDSVTAHGSYAKDTLNRAGWFQSKGFA
jgi:peptidoglycan hydrolase-like protein with peptidoglycan-binding domain